MTTFSNISDLLKKAANKTLYVKLSNGYFAPTTKQAIKKIAASMAKNEVKFQGNIFPADSNFFMQIELI